MSALANQEVGDYLNDHFVSTVLKVGTFTLVNGNKQGGNVVSYFCTADGGVVHAIVGPVDADTLLREARWVTEVRKLAMFESRGNFDNYREFIRRAHAERLSAEFGISVQEPHRPNYQPGYRAGSPADPFQKLSPRSRGWNSGSANQAKIHQLLVANPLIKVEQVYRYVFEKIAGERVSTLPVAER